MQLGSRGMLPIRLLSMALRSLGFDIRGCSERASLALFSDSTASMWCFRTSIGPCLLGSHPRSRQRGEKILPPFCPSKERGLRKFRGATAVRFVEKTFPRFLSFHLRAADLSRFRVDLISTMKDNQTTLYVGTSAIGSSTFIILRPMRRDECNLFPYLILSNTDEVHRRK